MLAVLTTIPTIVMTQILKMPVKKISNVRFGVQGQACSGTIQCLMELMPLRVPASYPMHESPRTLSLVILFCLTVANVVTSNLATSIDTIHLLITITTVVNTVMAMMPMLDSILPLTPVPTVADTVVTVFKMRGAVAIMIIGIAAMMGGMTTGPLTTATERGTTVIFTMTIGVPLPGDTTSVDDRSMEILHPHMNCN